MKVENTMNHTAEILKNIPVFAIIFSALIGVNVGLALARFAG